MNTFLIKLIENEIAIYENKDGYFIPLKHKGEEIQSYQEDTFWSWWKEKIEYDGRAVSFVLITDREEFVIPKNIAIEDENSFVKIAHINRRLSELSQGYNLLSFPHVEDFKTPPKCVEKQERVKKENSVIKEDSLVSYFRRKTDEYRD